MFWLIFNVWHINNNISFSSYTSSWFIHVFWLCWNGFHCFSMVFLMQVWSRIFPQRFTPQSHTPRPPFSAVQKKIKHKLLMAMCNKRFIHSSSISLQRFASLHYLPLHYTSIHFTIYFAPHSKSIPSFHIAKPTLCFPCLGFCFATATMFFVLK